MSASFADALLGYEFYLKSRGQASIHEVNAHLNRIRRAEISSRTYAHYRKLITHGFRSYVPINKFDVFQSLGKLQMAADRRRYSRRPANIAANIYRSNQNSTTECTIIDISLVGFGIRTTRKFPVRPGTQVWVEMDGYEPIPCFVAWRRHEGEGTRLGLRALEFIDNYRIQSESVSGMRPLGLLIIERQGEDEIDWNYFVHILEVGTELIEATADLLITVSELADIDLDLTKPVLSAIEFRSPGNAEIKIDFGIADIIRALGEIIENFGLRRKRYKTETRRVELENEALETKNEHARLENANLRIEVIRNALNLNAQANAIGVTGDAIMPLLQEPIKSALQISELPANLFEANSLERGILEERMLPAAVELINGDDPGYEINATTSVPSEEVAQVPNEDEQYKSKGVTDDRADSR